MMLNKFRFVLKTYFSNKVVAAHENITGDAASEEKLKRHHYGGWGSHYIIVHHRPENF
jgi:hypothetical protein